LAVSISLVVLLGIAVFLLCRYAGLRIMHALVCIMLGFFLASSSLAPEISHLTSSLIGLL
jgi:uncharacterized membrane protein